MNVSYAWLRALVPVDASPEQLRDLITTHVATVDELEPLRADLAPIVVARVVESVKIPETKLTANRVDTGAGELVDVVCGAPNVTVGKLYPFAPSGTTMPERGNKPGLKLEKRKIRGFLSNGMLCSARELALGEDEDGIWELDLDAAPGTPLLKALSVGDTRIVVDVLPNRPDLLSHAGIAREVAAVSGAAFALPPVEGAPAIAAAARTNGEGRTGGVTVRVEAPERAPRYMGAVIRGVTVGPSPDWLVQRLEAVGSRSINNVVDATNYVLHELGQPTHAFDLAKLGGGAVVVRRARSGEKLVTLDGAERELDESMTVIADGERAQAVAGVMGGRESEVSESTTDLFLEVATFDPAATRGTRRALGLSTDASYRFERGVDEMLAPQALERVAQLIVALAGGRVDGAPVDVYRGEPAPRVVRMRPARVERVLGAAVPAGEIGALLRRVGFETSVEGDALAVTVPTWRRDVVAEIDLIEEVARLRGYDTFPDELRLQRPSAVPDSADWVVSRRVREALVAAGLLEVRAMPFVDSREGAGYVRVTNPLAENEAYLRRDVLETLARRAEFNLAQMQGNLRLFEIGAAFRTADPFPVEEMRVAALVMGDRRPRHFTEPKPPAFDHWDAHWLATLAAHAAWPGAPVELREAEGDDYWTVVVSGTPRGVVRPVVLDAPVWAARAFGFELTFSSTSAAAEAEPGKRAPASSGDGAEAPHVPAYRPLPSQPAAEFDLALLLPPGVKAADVERVLRAAAGDVLESLELFDLFEGSGIEAGFRSLAWRLIFRHPERTFSGKEIDARRERILVTLQKELNVRPRTA